MLAQRFELQQGLGLIRVRHSSLLHLCFQVGQLSELAGRPAFLAAAWSAFIVPSLAVAFADRVNETEQVLFGRLGRLRILVC